SLLLRLMRVDADRAPDIVVLPGDSQHGIELRQLRADGDAGADAVLARARKDFRHLTGKVGKIEMAMAVDEHRNSQLTELQCSAPRERLRGRQDRLARLQMQRLRP